MYEKLKKIILTSFPLSVLFLIIVEKNDWFSVLFVLCFLTFIISSSIFIPMYIYKNRNNLLKKLSLNKLKRKEVFTETTKLSFKNNNSFDNDTTIDTLEISPKITAKSCIEVPKKNNDTNIQNKNKKKIQLKYKTHLKKALKDFNFVVVDIETTGFKPGEHEIIEIGAVRIVKGKITDEFSSLICPNLSISSRITKLTGITNEMVKYSPDAETVLKKFIDWVKPNDLLIAHNATFDKNFLKYFINEFDLEVLDNEWVDTLPLARAKVTTPNHKLDTLLTHFNIEIEKGERHRALGDARAEAILLHHLCKLVDDSLFVLIDTLH